MDKNSQYITAEKKSALEAELVDLKGPKRKEILESLEFAKSLGDLSENAEYHQAREEQGKLEERIHAIEHILREAHVVEKHHTTNVEIGSTVRVQKEGSSDKQTFQIVGSEEADVAGGKISNDSLLGRALYGKKKGDIATFTTPKGATNYKVLDIE